MQSHLTSRSLGVSADSIAEFLAEILERVEHRPEEAWKRDALCREIPANFYAERGESTRRAKAVCSRCAVVDECLEYALVNSEKFGIWGGTSERERRRIRQIRAAQRDEAAAKLRAVLARITSEGAA